MRSLSFIQTNKRNGKSNFCNHKSTRTLKCKREKKICNIQLNCEIQMNAIRLNFLRRSVQNEIKKAGGKKCLGMKQQINIIIFTASRCQTWTTDTQAHWLLFLGEFFYRLFIQFDRSNKTSKQQTHKTYKFSNDVLFLWFVGFSIFAPVHATYLKSM